MLTIMGKYNIQLDELFDYWSKESELHPINNDRCFVKDGLMLKNSDLNIDIEEAWDKIQKKVMFIAKDQNQSDNPTERYDQDSRTWLKDRKDVQELQGKNIKFWGNIAILLWGLYKTDSQNPWWYDEVMQHFDEVKLFFNTYPFAFIESKKQPGGPGLKSNVLKKYLDRDRDLLFKEIDILKPNMIVCFHHHIYGTVISKFPQDELIGIGEDHPIKYHPRTDTFIFCSYHPSYLNETPENIYQGVMHHYRVFLESEEYRMCKNK